MKKIRYIPYGYTIRDGNTVIHHGEAEVIRKIFEAYIKGSSLKEIAEELTRRQIPYTEKTTTWDKARIARIIDNARYTGTEEYDPIIDDELFEIAVATKAARFKVELTKDCEGLAVLRPRVRCGKCGYPMVRRIDSRRRVKESWSCENDACGFRVRIGDHELFERINLLMNRIIDNTNLLIPSRRQQKQDSPAVAKLQREIDEELKREHSSEELIISKIADIASQLYIETNSKEMIAAQIARKRAMLMKPQEFFNPNFFSDLIETVSLGESGQIKVHTKTDTIISEEATYYGSNENS